MQSHFYCGGDDIRPTDGILIETQFRKWCLAKMVSASSESHTISSEASLQHRPAIGRGAFGGETPIEDLLSDIEVDLSWEEEIYPGT